MRGRKPKDPYFNTLDGGRSKKRRRESTEIAGDYPTKPRGLTGEAGKVWHTLRLVFQDNGMLIRSTDVYALKDLCCCIARVEQLEREISDEPTVPAENSTAENPIERKNPRYQMLREYRDRMWKGFERFGMTPTDARRFPLASRGKTPRERLMEGFQPPASD